MISYELWDTNSFNLVDDFETELAALEAACELITRNRGIYPEALALARGDDGETVWLASGAELLERIERARTPPSALTAVPNSERPATPAPPRPRAGTRRTPSHRMPSQSG